MLLRDSCPDMCLDVLRNNTIGLADMVGAIDMAFCGTKCCRKPMLASRVATCKRHAEDGVHQRSIPYCYSQSLGLLFCSASSVPYADLHRYYRQYTCTATSINNPDSGDKSLQLEVELCI